MCELSSIQNPKLILVLLFTELFRKDLSSLHRTIQLVQLELTLDFDNMSVYHVY